MSDPAPPGAAQNLWIYFDSPDADNSKLVKDIIGDHKVYEDEVTIKAKVRRGEAGPMTVAVKFQACSDTTCLQAATVKTTLP